jgi:hypothetical protein
MLYHKEWNDIDEVSFQVHSFHSLNNVLTVVEESDIVEIKRIYFVLKYDVEYRFE